jgi:hypothetical protein
VRVRQVKAALQKRVDTVKVRLAVLDPSEASLVMGRQVTFFTPLHFGFLYGSSRMKQSGLQERDFTVYG